MVRVAIIVVASLWAWPAGAQAVVDGDTIKLKGVTWHLWGIETPENKQSCGTYPAERRRSDAARRKALEKFLLSKGMSLDDYHTLEKLASRPFYTDRDGHMSGLCRADGDDLSAAMVRLGMAWADVQYSRDYVQLEAEAKAAGLGVHTHACQPAWEWRAEHAPARQPSTPPVRPQ